MNIFYVNFLAILVAAIINLALGWAWYSPKLIGSLFYSHEEIRKMEHHKCSAWQFVGCFVEAFIMSWALAVLFLWLGPDLGGAVIIGLVAWLGFVVTTLYSGYNWGSMSFSKFLMNALYSLVYIVIISLVLGAWR